MEQILKYKKCNTFLPWAGNSHAATEDLPSKGKVKNTQRLIENTEYTLEAMAVRHKRK